MQDLCRLDLKQISQMIGSTTQLVSECWNNAQEPSIRGSQKSQWAPYAIVYNDSVLSLSFSKTENETHIHCMSAS